MAETSASATGTTASVTGQTASVTGMTASVTQDRTTLNPNVDESETAQTVPKCQLAYVKVRRLSDMELAQKRNLSE